MTRIAMIGQQDFGKAALEAFIARGDTVVGVFCKPEKPGERPDALRQAAQNAGVSVFQLPDLRERGSQSHAIFKCRYLHHGLCVAICTSIIG